MARIYLLIAAISGLLSVAIGAFGAHALKARLSSELMAIFHTGVQYQGIHSLALLGVGLLALQHPSRALNWSGTLFTMGILLFSGSLYLLSISGIHTLGIITPFGGLALMAGWMQLGVAAWKIPGQNG